MRRLPSHTHNRLLCARPSECCEAAGRWDGCGVRTGGWWVRRAVEASTEGREDVAGTMGRGGDLPLQRVHTGSRGPKGVQVSAWGPEQTRLGWSQGGSRRPPGGKLNRTTRSLALCLLPVSFSWIFQPFQPLICRVWVTGPNLRPPCPPLAFAALSLSLASRSQAPPVSIAAARSTANKREGGSQA